MEIKWRLCCCALLASVRGGKELGTRLINDGGGRDISKQYFERIGSLSVGKARLGVGSAVNGVSDDIYRKGDRYWST